jgi:hypothetical protein
VVCQCRGSNTLAVACHVDGVRTSLTLVCAAMANA